jgi:hypothetical protein
VLDYKNVGTSWIGKNLLMSKHHHHPHEGHRDGGSPESCRKPLHHSPFFWVAGFFILLALLGFIFSGNLAWQPSPLPTQAAPATGSTK